MGARLALLFLGMLALAEGEPAVATAHATRSEQILAPIGDREAASWLLGIHGTAAWLMGDHGAGRAAGVPARPGRWRRTASTSASEDVQRLLQVAHWIEIIMR